tara:strand:+ start:364 stop:2001 length:1638 start_codon:yes stop_codon:yes gene_type:complete
MDRNTLVAFFLISLVLIFTPKYMELVSPASTETKSTDSLFVEPTPPQVPVQETRSSTLAATRQIGQPALSSNPEEIISINTDLYSAEVSSMGGGSFNSFRFNRYFTADSKLVNIAKGNNLLITGKTLDGDDLNLSGPWDVHSKENGVIQKIVFKKEVFSGMFIYKSLLFYEDSYVVDVELDLTDVSNNIYRNAMFGWSGGLSSTEENLEDDLYYFNSYVYQGGELENLKVGKGESEDKTFNGTTDWAALRTKYFTVAIIPENNKAVDRVTLSGVGDEKTETYGASFVFDPINKEGFRLYLGPLEYDRVTSLGVGLESIMDFGWSFIRPISKGVLYALKSMHGFIPNYGFVLIVFAFLIKLIVYPLTKKSYQSMSAMQAVAPEINELKEKYKSNPTKLNQATMELYKKRGVNPLGGCLPMLLQMPLLFALFQVFRTTIELRAEPFIWWITDLSSPDTVLLLPFKIPIYGSHVAILPVLMVVSMFVQQRMMSGAAQQPQQKTMQYFMTAFFFLMFNGFPSGLNLYYTLFNVLTIAQQKLIPPDNKAA